MTNQSLAANLRDIIRIGEISYQAEPILEQAATALEVAPYWMPNTDNLELPDGMIYLSWRSRSGYSLSLNPKEISKMDTHVIAIPPPSEWTPE